MTAAGDSVGVTPAAKEDPETLVLRGRPRPVVRFRKGLLMGIAASLSVAVAGVAWVALEPSSFRFAAEDEGATPFSRPNTDALEGAPAAYSDVLKLGPPLPGDLGRPILEQQRRSAATPEMAVEDSGMTAAAQLAEAERQRRAAEEQSARTSAVLAQLSGRTTRAGDAASPQLEPPGGADERTETSPGDAQHHKVEFARSMQERPGVIIAPGSACTLTAGSIIPASLITGLNSDLPGLVIAQVTENVRDSASGRTILIPQGARLVGRYDSAISYGQQRALVVWDRIVFPNGGSLQLGKMPATDASGYAGLKGRVDSHPWQLLKGVILSTVLGLGSELSLGRNEVARAIRQSAQQNAAQAGDQLVRRSLDVQPTLTVPPGWPVRVLVDQDLLLEPWKG